MDDLISRQAAIDAIMSTDETCYIYWKTYYKDIIEALPSAQPKINNQINLCDSCKYLYPACPSGKEKDDVIFGNGIGNDNICACDKYDPLQTKEDE